MALSFLTQPAPRQATSFFFFFFFLKGHLSVGSSARFLRLVLGPWRREENFSIKGEMVHPPGPEESPVRVSQGEEK